MIYPIIRQLKMKSLRLIATVLIVLIVIPGCKKKAQEPACDCALLQQGLQANDETKVGIEIDKLCEDLLPAPSANDEYGQHDNLYKLAERVSRQCGLNTQVLHYNGIETFLPQSELKVTTGLSVPGCWISASPNNTGFCLKTCMNKT